MYRVHATAVRAYVRRRLPAEQIEEAVAEVWLTAWRRRAALPADPALWLYATARPVLANQRRGPLATGGLRARLAHEPPAAPISAVPDRTLAEALGELSRPERRAVQPACRSRRTTRSSAAL